VKQIKTVGSKSNPPMMGIHGYSAGWKYTSPPYKKHWRIGAGFEPADDGDQWLIGGLELHQPALQKTISKFM